VLERAPIPVLALVISACVDPMTTHATSTPAWEVTNAKGYVETAAGLPPDTVLAWDLRIAGGVARWRECTTVDVCSEVERDRPAAEVLAVDHVGQAAVGDAGAVEVVKLSLSPRPKYTVPVTKIR
jgi:hypothetical protein